MSTPNASAPRNAAPPSISRPKRWLLIVSLTLNFLFIGMLVGAAIKFHDNGPPPALKLAFGPFVRALDEDDRRSILRRLLANEELRLPTRQARDADMAEIVNALRADPFVIDEVRTYIDRQRAWLEAATLASEEAFLAHLIEMTPDARRAFADRLAVEIHSKEDDIEGFGRDMDNRP